MISCLLCVLDCGSKMEYDYLLRRMEQDQCLRSLENLNRTLFVYNLEHVRTDVLFHQKHLRLLEEKEATQEERETIERLLDRLSEIEENSKRYRINARVHKCCYDLRAVKIDLLKCIETTKQKTGCSDSYLIN